MSGQSERPPPLDIVKVEVGEEDDGTVTGGLGPGNVEREKKDDKDAEMLKSVASLLKSPSWVLCGSEEGEGLGRKLLDLGEKLEGWKKWERLGRLKQDENRDMRKRLGGAELRFEKIKESKEELRKTYDLEVERRIKAELELAELTKKAGDLVDPVLNEVGVQTEGSNEMVLQRSVHEVPMATAGVDVASGSASESESSTEDREQLQEDQDDTSSSSEICDDDDAGDDDEPATATIAASLATPQRSNIHHRISTGNLSGRHRFECALCKAILSTRENLNRHVNEVHAKEKEVRGNFSCYVCNKRFLYKSNFDQHLKTHPRKQSYTCKTCNKILKNRRNFQLHMESHNPNRKRKFACPTCSNKLFTSWDLTKHMVIHRSEKPFKCPQCPQRFKRSNQVKSHLVTHSEVMRFPCELCEKSFKRSGDLGKHVRIHTRERPYSCQTCQKTFTQAGNLSSHMKTHQGEEGKSHQCPFCEMKFADKFTCRRHQQSRHKSELAATAPPDSKMEKEFTD